MEKTFMEAMNFRHACKIFDENKKMPKEDLDFILEVGRKSPSSFGMEPWKFLVIQDEKLKEEIRPLCWNQVQITSCSELVIILAKIHDLKPETGIPRERFARRKMPQDTLDFKTNLYTNHLSDTLSSDENIYAWTRAQCYIALGNMMTAAASKGIDSCPIEGFEKEKLDSLLNLDTEKYQVAVLVPFGYRLNEQSTQIRLPKEKVVEYI